MLTSVSKDEEFSCASFDVCEKNDQLLNRPRKIENLLLMSGSQEIGSCFVSFQLNFEAL